MDPFSIAVEIEIATLILAGVGSLATWLHGKQKKMRHEQIERHHGEMKAQQEKHHSELMATNMLNQIDCK